METYSKTVKPVWETDVLVVGSGSAGATAALAAAEAGASVAIVERYGFMGGISTQVLDTFYGFFTPGEEPRKVVGGIPDRVVEALESYGRVVYRPNTYGAGQGITYDPEYLKVIWERMLRQAGVKVLFHTFVLDSLVEGGRVTGVVAANKAGLVSLKAKVVIDASGDADVAAASGVPFESAEHGPVQSLTTTFKMINVDVETARSVKKDQLHGLMAEAIESGDYQLPRREGSVHITPLPGVMVTNMTRVAEVDATDPLQISAAESEGRKQAMEYARFLQDYVPGYGDAVVGGFSTQIGVRESRRIFGQYRLKREDVVQARKFPDGIAQCGAPIEDHHAGTDTRWEYLPEGETYDIPYRCLLPKEIDGLLVAGRCLSAEHDAHASVRSMGQCMAMGQAAGVAAGMSAGSGVEPAALDIEKLRNKLAAVGALLS